MLGDPDQRAEVMRGARESLSEGVSLRTWEEVLPELANYIRVDRGGNVIFQWIIVFLSLFTIFNTILMSVLERTREFALQLALGVSSGILRAQIFVESCFMGALGGLLGVIIGGSLGYWMEIRGLDLTQLYKDGVDVSGFAIDTTVYADVTWDLMLNLWALVFVATVLLGLIPMRQISRIPIADALR